MTALIAAGITLLPALVTAGELDDSFADAPQWLDIRPDRGNSEGYAYITGPASPIMGFYNDDLEMSFWQGPSPLAFSIGKNDVWDRRYFGDRKQIIDLDAIHAMCFGGQIPAANGPVPPSSPQALYLAYDFPCPKPVGQLILRSPDLADATHWRAGRTRHGGLVAEAEAGAATARLLAFLCRTRNVFVVQGSWAGLTQSLRVELFRHHDTTPQGTSVAGLAHFAGQTGYDYAADPDNGPMAHPEAGHEGRFFWVRQSFPAEKTFPGGFECVLMGLIDGATPVLAARNGEAGLGEPATIHPVADEAYQRMPGYLKEVRIAIERFNSAASGSMASATLTGPSASLRLYVTAVTSRDATDPMAAAKAALEDAARQGALALALDSAMAGGQQIRDWRNSRVMHYNATSCSYTDSTPWHGDYHFNEGYLTR